MIFHCPVCGAPTGELATSGMQTLFCGACRFKYQVTAGTLENQGSRQVTPGRQTAQHPGSSGREYEFRIRQPDELKVVTLRLADRDDRFPPGRDDVVAIVHAMRGDVAENPVAIINQTTGSVEIVGKPGQATLMGSVLVGLSSGIVALFLLALMDVSGMVAFVVAALLSGLVAFAVQEKLKPRHAISPAQQEALERAAALLEQKTRLEQRITDVTSGRRRKVEIRGKLVGLQGKMQEVGAEMYQTRIDRINGALPLLDEQLALDDRLLEAYRRSLLMTEIEVESYNAADSIPENVWSELQAGQAEIQAIEARTSDLKLLLSANEEVERFVREE
jgi:hypothetical protein